MIEGIEVGDLRIRLLNNVALVNAKTRIVGSFSVTLQKTVFVFHVSGVIIRKLVGK